MGSTEGTTGTGTEVQHVMDLQEIALQALDASMEAEVADLYKTANAGAALFGSQMAALGVGIVKLHQLGTWARAKDENGEPFTSPRAYYADRHKQGVFPQPHKNLRVLLIESLIGENGTLEGVGNNELAAICGVNPSTISHEVTAVKEKLQASAPVITDDELDSIAADAAAKAAEKGADEAAAAYAAEQARAFAKQEAEDSAKREADAAAAKAKRDAETKAVNKSVKVFTTSVQGVRDNFHKYSDTQRTEVFDLVCDLATELDRMLAFIAESKAKAGPPTPPKPRTKPRGRQAS